MGTVRVGVVMALAVEVRARAAEAMAKAGIWEHSQAGKAADDTRVLGARVREAAETAEAEAERAREEVVRAAVGTEREAVETVAAGVETGRADVAREAVGRPRLAAVRVQVARVR